MALPGALLPANARHPPWDCHLPALQTACLEVRVGVYTGSVQRCADSIDAVAVHLAACIMSRAGSGQVLLSALTVALLEALGLSFSDAGEHELKGLDGSRRLHRLVSDTVDSGGEVA